MVVVLCGGLISMFVLLRWCVVMKLFLLVMLLLKKLGEVLVICGVSINWCSVMFLLLGLWILIIILLCCNCRLWWVVMVLVSVSVLVLWCGVEW